MTSSSVSPVRQHVRVGAPPVDKQQQAGVAGTCCGSVPVEQVPVEKSRREWRARSLPSIPIMVSALACVCIKRMCVSKAYVCE